jgi:hypothetical protein
MDDFQRAAAAAQRRRTEEAWTALPVREQAQAIYTELRRIDAERVAAMFTPNKRRATARSAVAAKLETRIPAHAG